MSASSGRTVEVFGTSILSNPKLRSNHESVQRILLAAKVPFAFHDVASDEAAKATYKRKNAGSTELPLVLSGGERVGSVEALQEAAEFGELRQFLKLDEPLASNPDDALLASLSAADANALANEIDSASARASSGVAASKEASKSAAATAAQNGVGVSEKPPEPVPTPSAFPEPGLTHPDGTPVLAGPGAADEEDEEEDVPIKGFGGLVPKDEVALKKEADQKEEEASLPTVPSGEKLAEAVKDDPQPSAVKHQ